MKKIVFFLLVLLTFALAFSLVGCDGDGDSTAPKVTINRTFVNMTVGDTYKLVSTVTPQEYADSQIIWSVGNGNVVSCRGGELRALSVGKTTVTASVEGTDAYFSCNVEVKEKLDNMYVVEGEVNELQTNKFENYFENAEYVSSSPEVVSVRSVDDKITFSALTPGKSTLSVTDGDGRLAVRTVVVLPKDTYGVNFDLPDTPVSVTYNRDDLYTTTLKITGFEVERSIDYNVLDTGEVTVTLRVRYKKTGDSGGEDAKNAIRFDINIYSEETTGVLKNLRVFQNDNGAEEYVYEFKFSAVLGTGDGERNFYLEIPSHIG